MIMVLTQASRPERLAHFMEANKEFIPMEDIIPFYSIPAKTGAESFRISQSKMLMTFIANAKPGDILEAFEDDCELKRPYIHLLDNCPPDIDILFLGCNLRGVKPEDTVYQGLKRIKTAWMSHATIYSWKGADFVARNYNPYKGQMFDDWLSEQLPNLQAYVLNPMVAFQWPCHSDIWGQVTDYTSTIEEGNRLMENLI